MSNTCQSIPLSYSASCIQIRCHFKIFKFVYSVDIFRQIMSCNLAANSERETRIQQKSTDIKQTVCKQAS